MTTGREQSASVVQYVLLGGFAAVASGISSQGLTGFARSNMALADPWPYLLFFSLDGAAGVCAVLLARRAARAEGGTAPRLAVWGLVAASATFNWTHAPGRPEAPEAYALMPVVAAVLFEFCLQETRARRVQRPERRIGVLRWLRPAERVRLHLLMSANRTLTAEEATRHVRAEAAARALYRLRIVTGTGGGRSRRALRRAHAALTAAGFADPVVAAEVLGRVQVLTMTTALATLDYASAEAAHAAIRSMITSGTLPGPVQLPTPAHDADSGPRADTAGDDCGIQATGEPASAAFTASLPGPQSVTAVPAASGLQQSREEPPVPGGQGAVGLDQQLIEAAGRIASEAAGNGTRLSQTALAEKLRGEGWAIANDRLSPLAAAIGLGSRRG